MEMLLIILKKYWLYILIGIVVLGALGYIKILKVERDHYETLSTNLAAELDTIKKTQEAEVERLKTQFAQQTATYKDSLKQSFATIDAQQKTIQGKIRENTQLKSVVIPDLTRQLYNASAASRLDTEAAITTTKQGDDGASGTCNLADLLATDADNLAKLERNAEKVEKWQSFWQDYQRNLNGPPTSP